MKAADLERLMILLRRALSMADYAVGRAGYLFVLRGRYDSFWMHRALEAWRVRNTVLNSANINVSRLRNHVITDGTNARGMLVRVLSDEEEE